jgi:hypothetical protein
MSGSRIEDAKAAAIAFARDFVQDNGGAHRYISVVAFDNDTTTVLSWTDAKDITNWSSSAGNAVYGAISGLTTGSGTCIEGGLQMAYNLLGVNTVSSLENKFVVLLSDGEPYNKVSRNRDSLTEINGTSTNKNDAKTKAEAVAAKITSPGDRDADLYSIYFNSDTSNAVAWLRTFSNAYAASDATELLGAFEAIIDQIELVTKAWSVTAPMGAYISFDSLMSSDALPGAIVTPTSENGYQLTWNLQQTTPVVTSSGSGSNYTYTLKYSITLDTTAPGFEENKYYLTGGYTYLNYALYKFDSSDVNHEYPILIDEEGNEIYNPDGSINTSSDGVTGSRTLAFKISAVKGSLPEYTYTVRHWLKNKTTGDYELQASETENHSAKLWSSVTVSAKTFTNYSFDSGPINNQQITQDNMVFDLKYDPDTTAVTINKYYKTVTIEEDGETNDPGYITSQQCINSFPFKVRQCPQPLLYKNGR